MASVDGSARLSKLCTRMLNRKRAAFLPRCVKNDIGAPINQDSAATAEHDLSLWETGDCPGEMPQAQRQHALRQSEIHAKLLGPKAVDPISLKMSHRSTSQTNACAARVF